MINKKWICRSLKANAKKFYLFLILFVNKAENIENFTIKSAKVLLVVTIDSNLSFRERVMHLCATANRKLNAASSVPKYISLKKYFKLIKSFIISQFSYCSLTWMTQSRRLNNKVIYIQTSQHLLKSYYLKVSP